MKFGPVRNPKTITADEIAALIDRGWMPALQFREVDYDRADLERINTLCQRFGDAMAVRFFRHGHGFDTSVLSALPDCTNLWIDAMMQISDFAPIAAMPKLRRLHFSVFGFESQDWLSRLDLPRFTKLMIGANEKRNYDLAPLADAVQLEELFVQGGVKGIERIAGHQRLRDIGLSGFAKSKALAFLNALPRLEKLMMILGSRQSIAELDHPGLADLAIIRVSLLEDLGPMNRFVGLRRLKIDQQRRLETIDLTGLNLDVLEIYDCKSLKRIVGVDVSRLSRANLPRHFLA